MKNVEYEEGNYKINILSNPKEPKLDMFIKNTKYEIGLKIDRDTQIGLVVEKTTYSNIFGSKTKTDEKPIYDEQKVAKELLDIGKAIIDFMIKCENLIAQDEKSKAEAIFKTMQLGINIFKG